MIQKTRRTLATLRLGDTASETVQFGTASLPALTNGLYSLSADLTVVPTGIDAGDTTVTSPAPVQFVVAGPQLSLLPSQILGVYPANGTTGDFRGLLPFVTLASPTLPWSIAMGTEGWSALAVIVVADADANPIPAATQSTAGAVIAGSSGGAVFWPALSVTQPPAADTPVTVLNLPTALFGTLMPSLGDLPYLAHVRQIANGGSSTMVASVLANRVPLAGGHCTAYLVSLEGWGDYLPADADGTYTPTPLPDGTTACQLVVLTSWQFTAFGAAQDFATLASNLTTGPLALPQPDVPSPPAALTEALGLGYVALPHRTRLGASTVSWYRGPLAPLGLPLDQGPAEAAGATSDAWMRYDPTTGMFDASYAAAWQLGRQLALADAGVVQAQTALRADGALRAIRRRQQAEFATRLGLAAPAPDGTPGNGEAPARAALMAVGGLYSRFAGARDNLLALTPGPAQDAPADTPAALANFLSGLADLSLVPWTYLIPFASLTPPESLSIFRVDPNWMAALCQGALSLGGDSAMPGTYPPVCGVLLNSALVSLYPTLRFAAADGVGPLTALRVAPIGTGMVLALFRGTMTTLTLSLPSDQLAFGFAVAEGVQQPSLSDLSLALRIVAAGDTAGRPYQQQNQDVTLSLGTNDGRGQSPGGVLDFTQLYGTVSAAFADNATLGDFSPAYLPLQLLYETAVVQFTVA